MGRGAVIRERSLDLWSDSSPGPEPEARAGRLESFGPIFVVGAHRSGTTLLRFMLTSHPRLFLPPESEFIPALFGTDPTRPVSRSRADGMLRRIFRLRFADDWRGERPRVADIVAGDGPVAPADLLDGLYSAYARQHGALRWGDKTPTYTSHILLLNRIFPAARFIHVVRDGRDVALSVLATWGHRLHVDLGFAAHTWVRRMTDAERARAHLPEGSFLKVRYEDLVAEPELELRRICRFVGEEFHPDMLAPERTARRFIPAESFHDEVRHPIASDRVGRWRTEMSARDLRIYEAIAGPALVRAGYPLAAERAPSAAERARVAALTGKYIAYRRARSLAEAVGLRIPN